MSARDDYKYRVVVSDPYAKKLLPEYLERKRTQIVSMLAALDAGDYRRIEHVAHRLHGSGMAYGLDAISAFGSRLEQAARARNAPTIQHLVEELDHYLEKLTIL